MSRHKSEKVTSGASAATNDNEFPPVDQMLNCLFGATDICCGFSNHERLKRLAAAGVYHEPAI